MKLIEKIYCLEDMYRCKEYAEFNADRLGNDLYINDPDRADRCDEAAEYGSDGSTHAEIIEDWREFLDMIDVSQKTRARIASEINRCEKWHIKNGSINQSVN